MGNEERGGYSKVQEVEEEEEEKCQDTTKTGLDFTFTISILSSTKTTDLSPADTIFSNGHLLPLSSTDPLKPPFIPDDQPPRLKSRSSSLLARWRRRRGGRSAEEREKKGRRFGWRAVKTYVMRPLFVVLGHGRRESNKGVFYSGDSRKKRGEMLSAPASIRVSPTDSGFVLPTSSSSNDNGNSGMEELQAAIQAAIAHCKNSIASQ